MHCRVFGRLFPAGMPVIPLPSTPDPPHSCDDQVVTPCQMSLKEEIVLCQGLLCPRKPCSIWVLTIFPPRSLFFNPTSRTPLIGASRVLASRFLHTLLPLPASLYISSPGKLFPCPSKCLSCRHPACPLSEITAMCCGSPSPALQTIFTPASFIGLLLQAATFRRAGPVTGPCLAPLISVPTDEGLQVCIIS